jgi:predicted membrane protein
MFKNKKQVLGVFLIAIGIIILLSRMDMIPDALSWITKWYSILLAIGLYNLITGNRSAAFIMLIIGGVFLVNDQGWFFLSWNYILPVVLIGIGIVFLFRNTYSGIQEGELSDEVFDSTSILGGAKHKITGNPVRGGRITCIMGGAEIDLRKAVISQGAIIEIFMVMGGAKITIPEEWNVQFEVNSIMSGFDDKRSVTFSPDAPTLIIRGTAFMGGGEIRS